jgi:hypothetical protein
VSRSRAFRLLVLPPVVLFGLAIPEIAAACSCVPVKPATQLERSDGAFVGRLLEAKRLDDGDGIISTADPTNYVYRVGLVAKQGSGLRRGRRVTVRSVYGGSSCGLSNTRGRLFGLFVERRGRRWHGSACSEVSPGVLRRLAARRSSQASGEALRRSGKSCARPDGKRGRRAS